MHWPIGSPSLTLKTFAHNIPYIQTINVLLDLVLRQLFRSTGERRVLGNVEDVPMSLNSICNLSTHAVKLVITLAAHNLSITINQINQSINQSINQVLLWCS